MQHMSVMVKILFSEYVEMIRGSASTSRKERVATNCLSDVDKSILLNVHGVNCTGSSGWAKPTDHR